MLRDLLHIRPQDYDIWHMILTLSVKDPQLGTITPTTVGVPQGLSISPVISILVLEWLQFIQPIGSFNIVQYSDDGLLIGPHKGIEAAAAELLARCSNDSGIS